MKERFTSLRPSGGFEPGNELTEPNIEDMRTEGGGAAYLVGAVEPNGAGVIFLHWFDEAPNANRTQFLEEAELLARRGVSSVLPQLTFPWHSPPTDAENDLLRIAAEGEAIRAAHASLLALRDVDQRRVALVGHDFGAMHGMTLFGVIELACAVLIAPTPRWSDWFLTFWPSSSDRFDYMRALSVVDPITTVTRAKCPLLFQFAKHDHYIAPMTGLELFGSAPEPKRMESYSAGHDLEAAPAGKDRIDFLSEHLRSIS